MEWWENNKMKLDAISGATDNLKGLFAGKKKIRQQLSMLMLYCIDRWFRVSKNEVHSKKWYKQKKKQKRKNCRI